MVVCSPDWSGTVLSQLPDASRFVRGTLDESASCDASEKPCVLRDGLPVRWWANPSLSMRPKMALTERLSLAAISVLEALLMTNCVRRRSSFSDQS